MIFDRQDVLLEVAAINDISCRIVVRNEVNLSSVGGQRHADAQPFRVFPDHLREMPCLFGVRRLLVVVQGDFIVPALHRRSRTDVHATARYPLHVEILSQRLIFQRMSAVLEFRCGGQMLGVRLSNVIQPLTDRQWRGGMTCTIVVMQVQHVRDDLRVDDRCWFRAVCKRE